jgi:hypothetical protein
MSDKEERSVWEKKIRRQLRRIEELDAEIGRRCALGLDYTKLLERRKTLVDEWANTVVEANVTIRHVPIQNDDAEFGAQQDDRLKSWNEVEIAFLSEERVEICVGSGHRKTYNYGELGFEDRRIGKQNEAWIMLRELAINRGTMRRPPPGKEKAKVQKRLQEIRTWLKRRYGIEDDPIPFNGADYLTSFKVSCKPSFDT